MGIVAVLPRVLLIIINLLLFLMSIALIVLGLMMRFASYLTVQLLSVALHQVNTTLKALYNSTGLSNSNMNLGDVFQTVGILAVVLGVIFLAFCFFGLFGACCKNECMLKTYIIISSLLVIGQLVVILIFLINRNVFMDMTRDSLKPSMDKYQGLNSTDAYSVVWSLLMVKLQCCGLRDYQDFKGSTSWWAVNKYATPIACCKVLPTTTAQVSACAGSTSTTAVASLTGSNYARGCVIEIWYQITSHWSVPVVVILGLVAQIVLVICGIIILVTKDKKNKVRPDSDRTPRNRPRRRENDW